MGKQASSKPGVAADLPMNQRHTENRHRIEGLSHTPENLRRSIDYNRDHAKEHLDAVKDRSKELKKAIKADEKAKK